MNSMQINVSQCIFFDVVVRLYFFDDLFEKIKSVASLAGKDLHKYDFFFQYTNSFYLAYDNLDFRV